MASGINPITGSSASNAASSSSSSSSSPPPPTEEMFLQLLVAQLQNQDPLNPTDSTQFVSQLAQFSELEQVIAIRNDIESAQSAQTANGGTSSGTNSSTAPAI
jgi:flagellar basal-body rod modification protein FlgD